ncbi:unnamed protein product [Adineta steineri]|uniref:G-protein coupled receptors family 1 profile domain-containing protein n=1 Tax=Adineta steineri TaxID=433720 RepID=A0A818QRH3_9BILA|nr:unnamed protein product [Adineta steineri]CAF0876606.1 unnamed protein product [Adineta steineri]CAF3645429.1 unnamed protein product [Adineta steineri]CAF4011970.1 unnamed protein product [Adineta steineri]CAF4144837.1 unnamed protein product [Adineta steineri]
MSSEMDYIKSLVSAQTYLFQFGGAFLICIGSIGCIFNLIIFSKKNLRKNPCSVYFIAYNIVNLFQICVSISQTMLEYGYSISTSTWSNSFCRFMYFSGYVVDILSSFYLIMASVDRMLFTSRDARMRRHSNHRIAYTCIIVGTIFSMLFHSPALIFANIIEIIPNYYICYSTSNGFLAFTNYYELIKVILIPTLMIICEICTIKNIQSSHHARVIPMSHIVGNALNPGRSKDRQLIKILLINITVYIIFNLMPAIVLPYEQIVQYQSKSLAQSQMNSFLISVSIFISYVPICISCYINLIVAKTFRNEMKNVLLCK